MGYIRYVLLAPVVLVVGYALNSVSTPDAIYMAKPVIVVQHPTPDEREQLDAQAAQEQRAALDARVDALRKELDRMHPPHVHLNMPWDRDIDGNVTYIPYTCGTYACRIGD